MVGILLGKFATHQATPTSKALNCKGYDKRRYTPRCGMRFALPAPPGVAETADAEGILKRRILKCPLPHQGACRFESGPRTPSKPPSPQLQRQPEALRILPPAPPRRLGSFFSLLGGRRWGRWRRTDGAKAPTLARRNEAGDPTTKAHRRPVWVLHAGPPLVGCENTPPVRHVY